MQQHPVFLRTVSKDKAILCTIIDPTEFGLETKADSFIMGATTKGNPYTGMNPTMTFMKDSQMPAKDYVDTLEQELGYEVEVRGNSIGGILTLPIWFIKKLKVLWNN